MQDVSCRMPRALENLNATVSAAPTKRRSCGRLKQDRRRRHGHECVTCPKGWFMTSGCQAAA
jgi:hypothetical protein